MRASYKWLRELCPFDATPAQVSAQLTSLGLEVEGEQRFGDLPGVVIAEVRAKRPHPSREKLTVVNVFDGQAEVEVVCGAPNVPAPDAGYCSRALDPRCRAASRSVSVRSAV